MRQSRVTIALDIGSLAIKVVAFNGDQDIIHKKKYPIKGRLSTSLLNVLEILSSGLENCDDAVITSIAGSNAAIISRSLHWKEVNDLMAAYYGCIRLNPDTGSILEIGGEHARFIRLDSSKNRSKRGIEDFYSNSVCSSGTGAFLEQEAHRLNLSSAEFGDLAAESKQKIRIAGRCAVFAKTDVVHQLQNGIPLADSLYALCKALVTNISSELIRNQTFQKPLVFIGGVAANRGIVKALKDVLDLDDQSLIIPRDHHYACAIGAHEYNRTQGFESGCAIRDVRAVLKGKIGANVQSKMCLPTLNLAEIPEEISVKNRKSKNVSMNREKILIGIDIGSTSTNLVTVSEEGEVYETYTIGTKGRPLSAVQECINHLKRLYGVFVPRAVGVTGSGRRFVSHIIGADTTVNEITAHAIGANFLIPGTDTVFDIGGQDSKYISLDQGSVVDFEMNKVCSAGTGSFLEEMAEILGLNIVDDFAEDAIRSKNPVDLGERCTVFMSSELLRRQQEGFLREDLVAGLCYSIVKNYLSRVVGRRKVGTSISFQGGVAGNKAVVAAMQNILNKPIKVHPFHEFAGAIGAAVLAGQLTRENTKFSGFASQDISHVKTRSFDCTMCNNQCNIHSISDTSDHVYYWGGICERYDEKKQSQKDTEYDCGSDPFQQREQELLRYVRSDPGKTVHIGIPNALHFYDLIPFWSTFFNQLNVRYVISSPTSRRTLIKGALSCPTNPCLPLKTAFGHCRELLDAGLGKLFIPCIKNVGFGTGEERLTHMCPAAQSWGFTSKTLFNKSASILSPTIRFSIPHFLKMDILRFRRTLGVGYQETLRAFAESLECQKAFYANMKIRGKQILNHRDPKKVYTIILSRPYTACDPYTYSRLRKIFMELDIVAIPYDMIDDSTLYSHELDGMYWYYGKRILQVASALHQYRNITVLFLSHFGCGADSFIIHLLRQTLRNIPVLELEIDEHSDFTGISTRLEAFVYSLKNRDRQQEQKIVPKEKRGIGKIQEKRLLIPQMSDHAYAFSAAFRSYHVDAHVLPLPDEETISLGREATGGQECCPCLFLVGDMLRYLKGNNTELNQLAFFMISGDGPCRLGQYPFLQRLILDKNGYEEVSILDASQDQSFYERLGIRSFDFKRLVWQGVVAIDLLFRKWREIRPYSDDWAGLDNAYRESLKMISDAIQKKEQLNHALIASFKDLERYYNHSIQKKPVIAVLGENYVRCNAVANAHIADTLERLGAEVWFPALYEWVYYTNWTARLHCRYEKQLSTYLKFLLFDGVERYDVFHLSRSVRKRLSNLRGPSVSRIFSMSSKYVPNTFEGETIIEIGRSIDSFQKGASGVVHVAPFGCIAGTIVETLAEGVSRDLNGFPTMTIRYDGDIQNDQMDQLECFLLQARNWQEREAEKV